jgi:hypothetical protein
MKALNTCRNFSFFILILLIIAFASLQYSNAQSTPKYSSLKSNLLLNGEVDTIHINNIYLPFENNGSIAEVNLPPNERSGKYGDGTFLFSSGFYLSGLTDGQLWANGVAGSNLQYDYLPGNYEIGSNDPRAIIYAVNSDDIVFGQSWQDWRDAVDLGADFYDGDQDGIYNPVDLNNNGEWDQNEDMPDLLGDRTLWCVFYDNVPANERRWNTVEPQGIEIRQTAFAYEIENGSLANTIFIRYRISNTGLLSSKLDSVYFTIWADADIGGDAWSDLIGCDSTLNAGYTYKDLPDAIYRNQPPTFLVDQLSGPVSYIPGETFIDINGNGEYDDGIDTPLDTARIIHGQNLGIQEFPGAKNLMPSSFVQNLSGDPFLDIPNNKEEARNYMLGRNRLGNSFDPCDTLYGKVMGGIDCNDVNPLFWYSGDPVTQIGWIGTHRDDQRSLLNVGPFALKEGEDKEIFLAYIVGQGTTPLGAIPVAKKWSHDNQIYYDNNFDISVSNLLDEMSVLSEFRLYQNYPNPFNPFTTIDYTVPQTSHVIINVYDVLGNKIQTLVNEFKNPGSYSINFEGSELSSGLYFYRIIANDFVQTKKMLLLK